MAKEITPLTEHVGVAVHGMSGADLTTPEAAAECATLLERYGVVVYREANVSDDDLMTLTGRLGQVSVVPTGEHERPEIQTITMQPGRATGVMAEIRRGNFLWHIDGATEATPQKGTLLSARQVDDKGEGGTQFVSTYVAYESLSEEDKELIDGLQVVHSFESAQRKINPQPSDALRAIFTRVPERTHPLVWKRRDGRRSMLLGATADHVVGWDREEGVALLERLLAWATRPEFVLHHDWAVGDLVTWDNTGMLHRAMPFEPTSPRLMHRTTLVGEELVA